MAILAERSGHFLGSLPEERDRLAPGQGTLQQILEVIRVERDPGITARDQREFPASVKIEQVGHGTIELKYGKGAEQSGVRARIERYDTDCYQFFGLGPFRDM